MNITNIKNLRSKLEELREKVKGVENLNTDILENNVMTNLHELETEITQDGKLEENKVLANMINDSIESLTSKANDLIQSFSFRVGYEKDNLIKEIEELFKNIEEEKDRIRYLKILGKKNLVLLGANGSGKSSFSAYMKNSLSDNIVVIPAQKILYYNKKDTDIPFMNREKILGIQKMNYNEKGIFDDQYNNGYNDRFNNLTIIFGALISLTINEYIEALNNKEKINSCEEKNNIVENTNYKKFIKLWSEIYPEISWEEDTNNRIIKPSKHDKLYNINDMSDGEKVVILYILSVLNAEENSYIIIDEPETFLNPSIYKKLWNLLENIRKDCIFIYISHNVDFISTRFNNDLYWLRSFDGENNWEIQQIDVDRFELPRELLTEILGSQVPIIFCEGTKGSLDNKVYSILFDGKASIIPVGGHIEVEKYTKLYNNIENKINTAYGIVDRDQHSLQKIDKYKNDNIFVLHFNEIEMLLISEEIVDILIEELPDENKIEKEKFKDKFFKIMKNRKEEIINKKIKAKVDEFFETEKADENMCDDTEEIIRNVSDRIRGLNIEEQKEETNEKIEKIINTKNYIEALKICYFKNILKVVGNELSYSKYEIHAIGKLQHNENLRDVLLKNYFSELLEMMGLSQDSTAQITE